MYEHVNSQHSRGVSAIPSTSGHSWRLAVLQRMPTKAVQQACHPVGMEVSRVARHHHVHTVCHWTGPLRAQHDLCKVNKTPQPCCCAETFVTTVPSLVCTRPRCRRPFQPRPNELGSRMDVLCASSNLRHVCTSLAATVNHATDTQCGCCQHKAVFHVTTHSAAVLDTHSTPLTPMCQLLET